MATILIVDDRAADRKFLGLLLRSAGHQVTEAGDGAEGLDAALRHRPQLVITDILMPSVDGFEFVRRMREIEGLEQTPVIFYTATYHEEEAGQLARHCGVASVMLKPSPSEAILTKVQRMLSSAAPATAAVADRETFDAEHLRVMQSTLVSRTDDLDVSRQRLAAIIELGEQLASETSPVARLRTVCDAVRDVTVAKFVVLWLLADDGTRVERVITSGLDPGLADRFGPPDLDHGVLASVTRSRGAVRLTNADGDPEFLGLPAGHPPVYSLLCVPMFWRGRTYGWIAACNRLGFDEFGEADERLVVTIGRQAALAYENGRLYFDLLGRTEELRASQERTEFALAAARMGTWEIDFSSREVHWSATTAAVFGLRQDQLPTSLDDAFLLVADEDRAQVQRTLQEAEAGGSTFTTDFRTRWPDGSLHWIAGRAQIRRAPDGTALRALGIAMDIDERRTLEEQLRVSQRLEAVAQLASGLAHDFNNLLTAVLGYANLVGSTLEPGDARRADLDEIARAAGQGAALTRQLLAIGRRQVTQAVVVDLNALVNDTSKMLGRLIGEHITLTRDLAPDLRSIVADPVQLEQIILNLAVNARDAMPDGGALEIATANLTLDAPSAARLGVTAGNYVRLEVRDDGGGMPAEVVARAFEPFFTTKERGHGTGLGLATVLSIVKQMGGHIGLASAVGEGTCVTVHIPATAGEAVREEQASVNGAAPGGRETVLLVEDERPVRVLARIILERKGYVVIEASEPSHVPAALAGHAGQVDLLLTDVMMPGLSGPELYQSLAAERPTLKVLYMSGYADDRAVRDGRLDTDGTFLQKPFTAENLAWAVRRALDR